MSEIINPKTLRGFRDSLPQEELARQSIQARLAGVFRRFGFVPIDTPALEYAEILLGKGGGETDKQVYRFLDHIPDGRVFVLRAETGEAVWASPGLGAHAHSSVS